MKKIFCLMGETAAGKTAIAMELAQRYPFYIISVDSTLVYKEMNIGTAKPTSSELEQVPQELINICDVTDIYSVGRFCEDVKKCIQRYEQSNDKKIPLLVGGTHMYFNAMQFGLSELPKANVLCRKEISGEAHKIGWPKLHEKLALLLPDIAAKIHPHDAQRIQRGLEIYYLSKGKIKKPKKAFSNYQFINILVLSPNRQAQRLRIQKRFDHMLEQGLIEEVKYFLNRKDVHEDLPAMKAVGYRQVIQYLKGDYDLTTMREKAIIATSQLAKRQKTWLRTWPSGVCFNIENPNLFENISQYIQQEIA